MNVGDPDVVELGFDGVDGGGCFKLWDVFIGLFQGNWKHFSDYSEVLVLGNDPVPVPDAEVTVSMTQANGSVETQSGVTNADGELDLIFTIFSYGNYVLSIDDISGENLVYVPELNTSSTIEVNVTGSDGQAVNGDERIRAFFDTFNAAFANGDIEQLFDTLHPAVVDRYGEDACRAYLAEVIQNPIAVEVIRVQDLSIWDYPIDDRTTAVENTYNILVNVSVQDQTGQTELHLALYGDADMGWFTDCGDPLN